MRHDSVSMNMPVEFINVVPVNPLISSCDIKVLYHGKNRNKSYITKAVANEMAKSLPNIPIVGEYLEEIGDFGDHGEEMVISSKGVKFIKRTVPFGVVPTDTKIWWEKYMDKDGVEREYMLCQGYLWTGRYPETNRVLESGNGQSMELNKDFMNGEWAKLENEDSEYFIVSEAIFSALCILGENVEPCFEGANITAPNAIYSLNKDDFNSQMGDFMLELKDALNKEGGQGKMNLENQENNGQDSVEDKAPIVNPTEDNSVVEPIVEPTIEPIVEPVVEPTVEPVVEPIVEPTTEEPEVEPVVEPTSEEEEPISIEPSYNLEEVEEYQTLKSEYAALESKYNDLLLAKEASDVELHSLREVKATVDKAAKTDLINKFYMLDEQDLEEVRGSMDNYSLEEIESKLSIIAFRKKVNFNLETEAQQDDIVAFNATQVDESVPAWVKALDKVKNNKR